MGNIILCIIQNKIITIHLRNIDFLSIRLFYNIFKILISYIIFNKKRNVYFLILMYGKETVDN